jgi:DNA repair protein SbcC/Rad50
MVARLRPVQQYGVSRSDARNMLRNAFKKDTAPVRPATSPPIGAQPKGAPPSPSVTEAELQGWREKIHAAGADDEALLQLAREAPGVDLKLAAIAALTQEGALRRAERDFRDQDKRLHRAAKSRWQAAVARREAAAEARVLIADARALIEEKRIPANRMADLDRAWAALNADLLDQALVAEFTGARGQLAARVRERGEAERSTARWLAGVDGAIRALTASLAEAAQNGTSAAPGSPAHSGAPAALAAALAQFLDSVPGSGEAALDARCSEKVDAANRALALASAVMQRAEFLQSLPSAGATDEALEKDKIERWRDFPGISDEGLRTMLALRFAGWREACSRERQRDRDTRRAHERELSAEQKKQRLGVVQRHVETAEAAHAAGRVAELTRAMAAIDGALEAGPVNADLAKRIESLRQEQLRLRDWQRWSGGQRREQLVAEAQALAGRAGEKIALKAHADAIDGLRERWKELDKLGGATSKALWLAFDGALKAAYLPVAAHLDKLRTAREENLAARDRIIDGLARSRERLFPAAQQGNDAPPSAAGGRPDWRAIDRTVEEARIAWRKLGPVEHTVPRKAQEGEHSVSARYAAALLALEGPLTQARREAAAQRERLVAAAKDLGGSQPLARDAIDKVRALQAQWRDQAKALPLARREENRLWSEFKEATDAVFVRRDATRAARKTEADGAVKAREAIIDGLLALSAADSKRGAAEIKAALASAETAWRACPEVPRPQAAVLAARYRAAREAAAKRLGNIAGQAVQARFDALAAAVALCLEREAAVEAAPDLETRWGALEGMPDPWKRAMEGRFRGAPAPRADPGEAALPDTLLNLEVACGIDSPSQFLAARQQLKIRALKDTLEGRRGRTSGPADIERWLLEAAAAPRPDELSRGRLERIIGAVRARPPA